MNNQMRELLESIDRKAEAGLCQYTLGGIRAFHQDIRLMIKKALAASQTCVAEPELPVKPEPLEFKDVMDMVARLPAAIQAYGYAKAGEGAADLRATLSASGQTAQAAMPNFDDGAAKRLRQVCNLVGLEKAVPESDVELWGCAFSVLGMIRNNLSRSAPQPSQVSEQDKLDAERYRFLRHADLDALHSQYYAGRDVPEGDEFDRIIDAARASQPKPE